MQQYILRRTLLNLLVIFFVATLVFLLLRIDTDYVMSQQLQQTQVGTDPAKVEQARQALREDLGLSGSIFEQYKNYMWDLARLDLGESFQGSQNVKEELVRRIGPSIELGLLQIIVAVTIAVPIGVISAIRQDRIIDYVMRFFSILLLGIPVFLLAVLVIVFTARQGGFWSEWLGVHNQWVDFFDNPIENMKRMTGPAIVGGLGSGAIIMRFLRSQMLEVMRQDYVRTAWAKGLRERVIILRHSLKNAMIPVLTVVGLLLGTIVSANVILETLFVIPGIGLWVVDAIQRFDYPIVQGVVLVVAVILVFVNLIVDIAYAWLDPRIRYG
jgi:peptide/nickel transport system permease protein